MLSGIECKLKRHERGCLSLLAVFNELKCCLPLNKKKRDIHTLSMRGVVWVEEPCSWHDLYLTRQTKGQSYTPFFCISVLRQKYTYIHLRRQGLESNAMKPLRDNELPNPSLRLADELRTCRFDILPVALAVNCKSNRNNSLSSGVWYPSHKEAPSCPCRWFEQAILETAIHFKYVV